MARELGEFDCRTASSITVHHHPSQSIAVHHCPHPTVRLAHPSQAPAIAAHCRPFSPGRWIPHPSGTQSITALPILPVHRFPRPREPSLSSSSSSNCPGAMTNHTYPSPSGSPPKKRIASFNLANQVQPIKPSNLINTPGPTICPASQYIGMVQSHLSIIKRNPCCSSTVHHCPYQSVQVPPSIHFHAHTSMVPAPLGPPSPPVAVPPRPSPSIVVPRRPSPSTAVHRRP